MMMTAPSDLGTAISSTAVARQTKTVTNLKPGERYTTRLVSEVGGISTPNSPIAQDCFQMGPDLNIPFPPRRRIQRVLCLCQSVS